jgi:hypothetical protein
MERGVVDGDGMIVLRWFAFSFCASMARRTEKMMVRGWHLLCSVLLVLSASFHTMLTGVYEDELIELKGSFLPAYLAMAVDKTVCRLDSITNSNS